MGSGELDLAFHHLLLRVAGWAPDEMLCTAREWLAQGRVAEVAQAVVFVAVAGRIPIAPDDLGVLRAALPDDAADHDQLADLDLGDETEPWWYAMAAACPERHTDQLEELPYSLDLTGDAAAGHDLDSTDLAAVAAMTDTELDGKVTALWRAWRCPAAPSPWPSPRRLYLVQAATEPAPLPMLTGHLQRVLLLAGETAPQVEAFTDPDYLGPYQRTALGRSALLWTARPTPPIRVAELFDPVEEVGGPGFAVTRPRLDNREYGDVLAYLEAASPILTTTALMDDVVDDRQHGVVPMNVRTDGQWIWTDAASYYLRQYGLAPDPELLHHIRTSRYEVPLVDAVAVHRAMAALQNGTTGEAG